MDPLERQAEAASQSSRQQGLTNARPIFDKEVTASEERGDGETNSVAFSDEHFTDVVLDPSCEAVHRGSCG